MAIPPNNLLNIALLKFFIKNDNPKKWLFAKKWFPVPTFIQNNPTPNRVLIKKHPNAASNAA